MLSRLISGAACRIRYEGHEPSRRHGDAECVDCVKKQEGVPSPVDYGVKVSVLNSVITVQGGTKAENEDNFGAFYA